MRDFSPRTRQLIQRLDAPAKLIAAATNLLPDGRTKRLIGGSAGVVSAAAEIVRGGNFGHDGWQSFHCEITAGLLTRHGVTVMRGPSQSLIKLGEHLIVTDDYNRQWMRSSSTYAEIVRDIATMHVESLAGAERLRLTETGLHDDGPSPAHEAEIVTELAARVSAELGAGATSRSILLVGPPGSGKSIAARQLASRIGERVVTMTSALLLGEHQEAAVAFVEGLRPDAVVIDDYDRRGESDGVSLDTMDRLRAAARVVIFTANSVDAFSPAELRPGRFDRIVYVTKLDVATAGMIGADLPDSIRDQAVGSLLAGYLQELVVRVRGGAEPRAELDELTKRQQEAESQGWSPRPRGAKAIVMAAEVR